MHYYLHPRNTPYNRRAGETLASRMSEEARYVLDDGGATCLIAWTEYDEEKDEDVMWCARVGNGYPSDMRLSPDEMEAQLESEWAEITRHDEDTDEETDEETETNAWSYRDPYAQRREEIKSIVQSFTAEEVELLDSTPIYTSEHMHLKGIKDKYGLSWKEVKGMIGGLLHRYR